MRSGVILGASLAALIGLGGCVDPGATRTDREHPDILLISIDSLRADHLSSYGYRKPTSPTLDRLAAEGVRFAQAISSSPWTLPSHAAMFTGLYDSAHGAVDDGLKLAAGHVTLAEALRSEGYQTAGFFGGPYLDPSFGLDQGFDVYVDCMSEPSDADLLGARAIQRANAASHSDVTGPRTLEAFQEWFAGADERPFFSFVHLWDVHYNYFAPSEIVELFDPDYSGPIDGRSFIHDARIRQDMSPRDLKHLVAHYDAEIRFTDGIVAALLETLGAAARLEDTIIIVVGDHGEEFFEHMGKGHTSSLFDELVRVPWIVRWKGRLSRGHVVEQQVRLIDLMPTVLSLAGVSLPVEVDVQGRDLLPLLIGERLPEEPAISELYTPKLTLRSVRTSSHKLVTLGPQGRKARYWFDLEGDPGETRRGTPPPNAAVLEAHLERTLRDSQKRLSSRIGAADDSDLDEDMLRRLEALGYRERVER